MSHVNNPPPPSIHDFTALANRTTGTDQVKLTQGVLSTRAPSMFDGFSLTAPDPQPFKKAQTAFENALGQSYPKHIVAKALEGYDSSKPLTAMDVTTITDKAYALNNSPQEQMRRGLNIALTAPPTSGGDIMMFNANLRVAMGAGGPGRIEGLFREVVPQLSDAQVTSLNAFLTAAKAQGNITPDQRGAIERIEALLAPPVQRVRTEPVLGPPVAAAVPIAPS